MSSITLELTSMIIAHAPAGYILHQILPKSWTKYPRSLYVTVIGSIAPDFDFAYKILLHPPQSHRLFITHTPVFWLVTWALAWSIAPRLGIRRGLVHCFFGATILHLTLDIPTGIRLFWPWSEYFSNWVGPIYHTITPSTFLHPYVMAEFVIIGIAIIIWAKRNVTI